MAGPGTADHTHVQQHISMRSLDVCRAIARLQLCHAASATGMPTNNDTIVCPDALNSCYYLIRTAASYSAQRSKCQAMGGEPAQW